MIRLLAARKDLIAGLPAQRALIEEQGNLARHITWNTGSVSTMSSASSNGMAARRRHQVPV